MEKELANLKAKLEAQRDILRNSAANTRMMANFYGMCLNEIMDAGFDLTSIPTIKCVLPERHIESLELEIIKLRSLEKKVGEQVPCLPILEDFHTRLLKL